MRRLALLAAFLLLLGGAAIALAQGAKWRPVPTRAHAAQTPDGGPVLRIQLRPDQGTLCECYVHSGRVACRCAETV